jgi:hypothetical protein
MAGADPLGGGTMPLSVFLGRLEEGREAALQVANPSSEQQSLIRLAGRLDRVPGLAALPVDYAASFQEIDELTLLLDTLSKEEATLRVLGDDTFPGTIIGRLQTAITETGASTYVGCLDFIFYFFSVYFMFHVLKILPIEA